MHDDPDPDRHLTDEPAGATVARLAQERRDRFDGPLPDTSGSATDNLDDVPRCTCGRPTDAGGEHDGGYGAWCG